MFTMMNAARLGVGIQGVGVAEAAYQASLTYARERLQMRSLTGPQNPDGPADPIIVHPDVRRMLLTQKALIEGGRALAYYTAQQADLAEFGPPAERDDAETMLSFLTPIVKAFLTETGFESVNHAVQIFGGHGFIRGNRRRTIRARLPDHVDLRRHDADSGARPARPQGHVDARQSVARIRRGNAARRAFVRRVRCRTSALRSTASPPNGRR